MLPLSIEIVNGGVYYFVLSNGNVKGGLPMHSGIARNTKAMVSVIHNEQFPPRTKLMGMINRRPAYALRDSTQHKGDWLVSYTTSSSLHNESSLNFGILIIFGG